MKAFLPLLFCLVMGSAQAQPQAPVAALQFDAATQRLTCSDTIAVPGVSQADLYARAQAWLATAYQTTPTVAQKAAGVVQGTGWREIEMVADEEKSLPLNLRYTITLAVQPGGYRYAISEFQTQHESTPADATPARQALEAVLRNEQALPPPHTDYGYQAAAAAQAIADAIRAAMASPASSPKPKTR
jgi:hypothetical protein